MEALKLKFTWGLKQQTGLGEAKLIPREHICSDLGHEAAEQLTAVKPALLRQGTRCQLAPDSASTKINQHPVQATGHKCGAKRTSKH